MWYTETPTWNGCFKNILRDLRYCLSEEQEVSKFATYADPRHGFDFHVRENLGFLPTSYQHSSFNTPDNKSSS